MSIHQVQVVPAEQGILFCPVLAKNENHYGDTDPRWERKAYLRVRLWSSKIN
jgi:hypothetical protein